jgi:cell division protein FtsL
MASFDLATSLEVPVRHAPSRPRPERRRRRSSSRRMAGGLVWIVVSAVLLGGVVALNVVVLRLNMDLDRAGRERANLRADNALLASQLSSAAASARIQSLARARGLVPADPAATTYVELGRSRR